MFLSDDCDDCAPYYLRKTHSSPLFAHAVLLFTFVTCAAFASFKLLPRVSLDAALKLPAKSHEDARLPQHNFDFNPSSRRKWRNVASRVSALTFAANIALSAVLVELLLCEILNALDPQARTSALHVTTASLMVLLILVTPAMEIHSILAAVGFNFEAPGKGRRRMAWAFEAAGLATWLFAFWYIGQGVRMYLRPGVHLETQTFSEGCLERVGIIGISLMASLSGFAAVSAVWQRWGAKHRKVTDADIDRRQAGLEATEDMLRVKRSRLRALERKISETPSAGMLKSVIGTLRGGNDSSERSTLAFEIRGLESMQLSLGNALYILQTRRSEQQRSHTTSGRLHAVFLYCFSIYCAFRLGSASLSLLRRIILPRVFQPAASTDPVTSVLALLAKHWDPTLNREAWTRLVSFLLSGVMLFASFNSALQTFLLLARAFPGLAASATAFRDASLALLVSQVVATYVISSALLLRSNLPEDVGSVISEALRAPLEPKKVDAWFEAWFLGAAGLTMLGIWVGRKMQEEDDDGDGETGWEMGKRS